MYTLSDSMDSDDGGVDRRSYIGNAGAGGHTGAIAALAYDHHMNRIISAGYDRAVKVSHGLQLQSVWIIPAAAVS